MSVPTCRHFVTMTIDSIISVDSQLGDPIHFPGKFILDLCAFVERNSEDAVTKEWLSSHRLHITYRKALAFHKRLVQEGELHEAAKHLASFLGDDYILSNKDLRTRSYVIDVAMTLGDVDLAQFVLSEIQDADCLAQKYMTIGRRSLADKKRDQKRRALQSLEVIFLCCLRARMWMRAGSLLQKLEDASPGYFTSTASYSNLWPWQRCLYAGSVYEDQQKYSLSTLYFLQSWMFVRGVYISIPIESERRLLWDSPDVVRLLASLARRSLRLAEDQPGLGTIESIADPRIDTRIFQAMGPFSLDLELVYEDALLFLENGRAENVWAAAERHHGTPYDVIEANYKYQM
jgi:hypothetical protein